jgi:hypothetical protein
MAKKFFTSPTPASASGPMKAVSKIRNLQQDRINGLCWSRCRLVRPIRFQIREGLFHHE